MSEAHMSALWHTEGADGHTPLLPEWTWLVRLCTRFTSDRATAEDLAQETLIIAWQHAHELRDPAARPAWLAGIARRRCLMWARRRQREVGRVVDIHRPPDAPAVSPLEDLPDDVDLELQLERDELADLLDRALALLPAATGQALMERRDTGGPPASRQGGFAPRAGDAFRPRGRVVWPRPEGLRGRAGNAHLVSDVRAASLARAHGRHGKRVAAPLPGVRHDAGVHFCARGAFGQDMPRHQGVQAGPQQAAALDGRLLGGPRRRPRPLPAVRSARMTTTRRVVPRPGPSARRAIAVPMRTSAVSPSGNRRPNGSGAPTRASGRSHRAMWRSLAAPRW